LTGHEIDGVLCSEQQKQTKGVTKPSNYNNKKQLKSGSSWQGMTPYNDCQWSMPVFKNTPVSLIG